MNLNDIPAVDTPTATIQVPPSPTEKPGDRIGRYKLLQELGQGGCGVVFMAAQEEPVRRLVALKVIKAGMDTRQVLARFEAERQALALMDYPNIAKVLDAGATEHGRPFFVMELVKGIAITRVCDENRYDTRQRLELFVQVCNAIQHAHQKGIIHRDIKPSNILVADHDGVPIPKIIDFGLAKATKDQRLTDKTLFTAFDQFIGTPAYMSPEQAKLSGLDIDTRTDIYSLGVLLYELLTGKTPFEHKRLMKVGLDEVRRIIREDEPPRPSTRLSTLAAPEQTEVAKRRQSEPPRLVQLVRGDLDWIVMKCLEKDRVRRYETANGLATDIQRYLKNEPIAARPPSGLYQFQKLIKRNRLRFAAVAGIIAVASAGGTVAIWQNLEAHRERDRANRLATENETVRLKVAEQNFLDWLRLVDRSAQLGHWSRAAADFEKAVELSPTNHDIWYRLMPLLAQTSDSVSWHKHCQGMLARFGSTSVAYLAERTAKVCLLLPTDGTNLAIAAKLADMALNTGQRDPGRAYCALAKTLAEYRRGNFTGADTWAQEVLKYSGADISRDVQALAVQAMARHQLGHQQEAEAALVEGSQLAEGNLKLNAVGNAWHDVLIAHILLREAKARLETEARKKNP